MNSYDGVSLSADSRSLVTVQSQLNSDIWIVRQEGTSRGRRITSGTAKHDGASGIAWTPDGKIVYSSSLNEAWDLWIMEADGCNPRQLTVDGGSVWPAVSPDGQSVVFGSWRTGKINIWRMDIDGSEPKQLTTGDSDSFPQISPDGKWVVYNSRRSVTPTVWKVPIEGGPSVQLTHELSNAPSISPDGKLIAYQSYDQDARYRVTVIPFEGGMPTKILDAPVQRTAGLTGLSPFRWSDDGRALTYVETRKGISNIWSQPLAGGPAKQLTRFASDQIFWFAWSPGGKQLALTRGTITSDVVLLTDLR